MDWPLYPFLLVDSCLSHHQHYHSLERLLDLVGLHGLVELCAHKLDVGGLQTEPLHGAAARVGALRLGEEVGDGRAGRSSDLRGEASWKDQERETSPGKREGVEGVCGEGEGRGVGNVRVRGRESRWKPSALPEHAIKGEDVETIAAAFFISAHLSTDQNSPSQPTEALGCNHKPSLTADKPGEALGRRLLRLGILLDEPHQQLLPHEVALPQNDLLEESGAPLIGGDGLQLPAQQEEAAEHGVALADDHRVVDVQAVLQALADGVQDRVGHDGEEVTLQGGGI